CEQQLAKLKNFITNYLAACFKENKLLNSNQMQNLAEEITSYLQQKTIERYKTALYQTIKQDEKEMRNVLYYVIRKQEILEKINRLKYKAIIIANNEMKDHDYKKMIEQNKTIPLYQLSIDFINTVLADAQ
ncbi:MAG: hypothetical protein ACP5H9_03980, partial [Candidatus Woesearchaeota archaeon]